MRRSIGVQLPKGVFRVKRWWYYQRRRGKPDHGPLVKLPEFGTPEFWARIGEIERGHAGPEPWSVDALIDAYKAHQKFTGMSASSRKTYGFALDHISRRWGPLRADGITPPAVQAFLDEAFTERPAMGNMVLAVLKTLAKFGVPRKFLASNPAREIDQLDEVGVGTRPWPEDVWRFVVDHAPVEVARFAVLGRATGQRGVDLIRMRPLDRDGAGIIVDIQKTGRDQHWCPLSKADSAMIDGWGVFPAANYITDAAGKKVGLHQLRGRFTRFLAAHSELPMVKLHGLRAMAVCDRRIAGEPHQRIAAQIGFSLRMVMHYSRHIDQRLAAGDEREQNEAVKTPALGVKT